MPDHSPIGRGDMWIVIPKWEEFQHRDMARTKVPPWLKAYTRLLSDDDFLDLSHHLRGVLLGLWLEYARSTRQLRDSTSALSRRLGQRVTTRDLESLNHAGFLAFSASKPASNPASTLAGLDGEGEGEPPIPPPAEPLPAKPERQTRPRRRRATTNDTVDPQSLLPYGCPHCSQRRRTQAELDDHLENVHGHDTAAASAATTADNDWLS